MSKKYISVDEYLMGRATLTALSPTIVANINTLIPKINDLLEKFGQYRAVNSGLRTMEDHVRIYANINKKRREQGRAELNIPLGSKHLSGAAVDLEDKSGELKRWLLENVQVLEDLGLYCEEFTHTPSWVHIQHIPPNSKRRFFKP